ncbi:hypothetical protein Athai_48290 [Actinocatenispora thailandica]|uniref:Uncharacterized protein n=1 Tax=Actinocatenispora thailandica TaxID=227318 RepID=A0A7R7HZ75_9ACTN|nr:hypothetical protein [Actinocatenispora thailandica]BCJ37326.1 hypothetical protein Athai_48290 [Actinocatenispora thailandica]
MSDLIRSWKDPDSTAAAANPAGEIDLAAETGGMIADSWGSVCPASCNATVGKGTCMVSATIGCC